MSEDTRLFIELEKLMKVRSKEADKKQLKRLFSKSFYYEGILGALKMKLMINFIEILYEYYCEEGTKKWFKPTPEG